MKKIRLYTFAQLEELDRKGLLKAVLGSDCSDIEEIDPEEIEIEVWQNPNPQRPTPGVAK